MKIKYKGLIREKMPSGAYRYRVRVAGQRNRKITLSVGPEHKQFRELYDAARVGEILQPDLPPTERPNAFTVQWMCDTYLEALEEKVKQGNGSPLTVKQRRSLAGILCNQKSEAANSTGQTFADLHCDIPRSELMKLRDRLMGTPGQCANLFKMLRSMYDWAKERGYVSENPARGIKVTYVSKGGAVPWTLEDLSAYRKRHPVGTTAHLTLSLFMFTACRIGDIYKLGRANEVTENGLRYIAWQPAKKGSSFVKIPMLPPLQRAVDSMTVVGSTYILSTYGRPYTSMEAMRMRFSRWCTEAGIENRSAHGIRKAAGHLLSLHGATQYEIMAVHGHAKASTSEIYTKGVERQRLAASAVNKLASLDW